MLQDIVHTFVGQAAPEAAQQLAGLSQDVEPGKREQKRDELIGGSSIRFLTRHRWTSAL